MKNSSPITFKFAKLYWLLLSISSVFLFSSIAEARQLVKWNFASNQNRLEFTTDEGVQPTAQMIFNPNRLVIDLPGTRLGKPTVNQSVGGAIKQVRVGQFENNTTRLVVELASGFAIDPNQVKFRGSYTNQWSVQLPTPQRVTATPPSQPNTQDFVITQNGLFARLGSSNSTENIVVTRSSDRRQIDVYLEGVVFPGTLSDKAFPLNQYGLRGVQFNQQNKFARVILNVDANSPDWKAYVSPRGNLTLFPEGGLFPLDPDNPLPTTGNPNTPDRIALPVPPPDRNVALQVPRPTPTPTPSPTPSTPPSSSPNPNLPKIPQGKVSITIDPGHGGKDPGAIGIGGLRETDVVLPISQEVTRILEAQGVKVRMTRNNNTFVSLAGRTQLANRAGSDLFVSIHANAVGGGNSSVNGTETFYYQSGRRLAQSIQSTIIRRLGMNNRGVKQARFYVLRNSAMPSALVEVGFVTGRVDAAKLRDANFRNQMAAAIAEGILLYIQNYEL
ncbi:MAG: N-acetylmuramoyl-L-alanine amidase [Spirulinaceae cyanobacterium]